MLGGLQQQRHRTLSPFEVEVHSAAQRRQSRPISLGALAAVMDVGGCAAPLFFSAAALASRATDGLTVADFGFPISAAPTCALNASTLRLKARRFFTVATVLLRLCSARRVGPAGHELNESGLLPNPVVHTCDINPILDESSFIVQRFRALLSDQAGPSSSETLAQTPPAARWGACCRLNRPAASPGSRIAA
jgi:hypothetical protein